jgi:Tol biopolymer transport system component
MHLRQSLILLIMLIFVLVAGGGDTRVAAQRDDPCRTLVVRAFSELGTNCANLGRNSVCYGFPTLEATFAGQTGVVLGAPGDRAELTQLSTIHTAPINLANAVWGVGALHVQANIHNGMVNTTALYMMLGDVELTNLVSPNDALLPVQAMSIAVVAETVIRKTPGEDAQALGPAGIGTTLLVDGVSPDAAWARVLFQTQAAWVDVGSLDPAADLSTLPVITRNSRTPLQDFEFRTGAANNACPSVMPPVLMVQSPQNTSIDITANGTAIRVGSIIFLRTLPDGRTQVLTSDGEATIYPDTGREVVVPPGVTVTLPLEPPLTWTDWRVMDQTEWDPYASIESIPPNIGPYPIPDPPIITRPSGVGRPLPRVQTESGTYTPITPAPRTFPVIEMVTGELGQDLERVAWQPFDVGCAMCDDELVLYSANADGDWDIFRLANNGLSMPENNLSRGPGSNDIEPSLSADNQWAAFTSNRDLLGKWEIWVARTDGSQQLRLTYNSAIDVNPVWEPGGEGCETGRSYSRLAFESNRGGTWDLYMADVSTVDPEIRLTDDPANDINAFWAPDGESIYFQSDRDGDWEIFRLDLNTNAVTQITDNSIADVKPVIAHNGTMLAWLQENSFGVFDLWVMDLATNQARQLTDTGADVDSHVFAPDDTFMAYHSSLDGDFDIYAVEIATGLIKALTVNNLEDRAPTFRCAAPTVIYHSDLDAQADAPGMREIYQVNPLPLNGPPSQPVRLTLEALYDNIFPLSDPREKIISSTTIMP